MSASRDSEPGGAGPADDWRADGERSDAAGNSLRQLRRARLMALIWLAAAGAMLITYAAIPDDTTKGVTARLLLMYGAGVLLLSLAIVTIAVKSVLGTARHPARARVIELLVLIIASVVFYAITYYRLAQAPGQMAGLTTWIDSVYFTVSTSVTVGFGDVHATGQVARLVVIVQMVFNVIFIAIAIRMIPELVRLQRSAR